MSEQTKTKPVRVLVDCEINGKKCRPNDVVDVGVDLIDVLEADGKADSNAKAVAYARTQVVAPAHDDRVIE